MLKNSVMSSVVILILRMAFSKLVSLSKSRVSSANKLMIAQLGVQLILFKYDTRTKTSNTLPCGTPVTMFLPLGNLLLTLLH